MKILYVNVATDVITDFFLRDTSIACDPHVWSQLSTLIRMQLPPTETEVAALPQGPDP